MPRRIYRVKPEDEGERIDRLLSAMEWAPSRAYIQKLLKNGKVFVNGSPVKASYRPEAGEEILVEEEEPEPAGVEAQPLPLAILYEDEDLIVINKPRGMVVHPAPGNRENTLVNALLAHCRELSGVGGVARPGIVHRLDKDTSGVLVAAKNDFTHLALARQFQERTMTKNTWPWSTGGFHPRKGRSTRPSGAIRSTGKRWPSFLPASRRSPVTGSWSMPGPVRYWRLLWKPAGPTRSASICSISATRW